MLALPLGKALVLKTPGRLVQIVECRRVLKWTYAYGYYLPDDDVAKKNFFEYSQGKLGLLQ
jgi:hypothetical protein